MKKTERKMNERDLEGLLQMRTRDRVHRPKKGKGSFNRQKEKQISGDDWSPKM